MAGAAIFVGIIVIYVMARHRKFESDLAKAEALLEPVRKLFPYKARSKTMEPSEFLVHQELLKQLPEGYDVVPKIRMADFMDTTNGDFEWERKIFGKHVDFLIRGKYTKPIFAIEVNGGYHSSPEMAENDKFKKEALEAAGIPLEVINVGSDFSLMVKEIIERRIIKSI